MHKEDGFEIVPSEPVKMEDYDIDSLSETLAIAKKMIHARSRNQIIESSYSRFAFEDQDNLPKWFVQDEKAHNFKMPPVTKEEVQAEKERLLAINSKAPKKILEAQFRKKKRVAK